jgi:hypothetical protein
MPERGMTDEEDGLSYGLEEYKGKAVEPHPDFMVVYNQEGAAIFKEVDLAIITLKKPAGNLPSSIKLARSRARRGDRVVMVGYGFGRTDKSDKKFGNRLAGGSVVVDVLGSGSRDVTFHAREEPSDGGIPSGIHGGDSGGTCFSRTDDSLLVGIATSVTSHDVREKKSVFTSIFPHRDWIKQVAAAQGETVR